MPSAPSTAPVLPASEAGHVHDHGALQGHKSAHDHAARHHDHGAHGHAHTGAARRPATTRIAPSILRLSAATRLALAAALIVPLWVAVLFVVG